MIIRRSKSTSFHGICIDQIATSGEQFSKNIFKQQLANLLGDDYSEITDNEFETLSMTIFKGLYSIGLLSAIER